MTIKDEEPEILSFLLLKFLFADYQHECIYRFRRIYPS